MWTQRSSLCSAKLVLAEKHHFAIVVVCRVTWVYTVGDIYILWRYAVEYTFSCYILWATYTVDYVLSTVYIVLYTVYIYCGVYAVGNMGIYCG